MIWAYLWMLVGCTIWNAAFLIMKISTGGWQCVPAAFGLNFGDCWKHVVCGILSAFDISSYIMGVEQAGALFCSIVRLTGCMFVTVFLLKYVVGRDITPAQKHVLVP